MKRIIAIAALSTCIAVPSFAQMKVVKQVERIVKSSKPDIKTGRELIEQALQNPESKEDAKTWVVAGELEHKVVDEEKTKLMLQQKADEVKMYEALGKMYPYYIEAYRLDGLPDSKGRVKRHYTKQIKEALQENRDFYINAGSYYLEKRDFEKAHEYFKDYTDIKNHELFEGTDFAKADSTSMQIAFFQAYAASQAGKREIAIEEYEQIKSVPYRQSDVYQLLANEYLRAEDSVKYMNTIEEGAKLFPKEKYFTFNLINNYIQSGDNDKAIAYLDRALENDPDNTQLINVKGKVYEQGFKDMAKAEEMYKLALSKDPNDAESSIDLGRIYYNQAVAMQSDANALDTDSDGAKKKDAAAKELFKKALPYFEKAVELKPDETEYLMALRGIYYNLGNDAKVEELSKKLGVE